MKSIHFYILKKRGIALIALISLLVFSCTNEEPVSVTPGKGETRVMFSLNLPANGSPGTRVLSEEDETNVQTIEVLVFKGGKYSYTAYGKMKGDSSAEVLLVKSEDENDKYDLVILANSRAKVMAAVKGFTKDATGKDDALKALTETVVGKWNAASGTTLPMSSDPQLHAGLEIIDEMSITVDLHRALARVNVELTGTTNVNFKLTSVRVYNYNTVGALVPYNTAWAAHTTESGKFKVLSPTIPNQLSVKGPLEYDGNDDGTECTNEIYLFEATNYDAGSLKPLTNRTCIVIGGIYDPTGTSTFPVGTAETFYRADFYNSGSHLDILRNYSYNFNITAISGPGFSDAGDAFEAEPANIEVDIVAWNQVGMDDIVWNGQNYLGISPAKFDFYKDATLGNQFTITTDFPGGWEILGATKEWNGGGAATWIKNISLLSGSGEGTLVTFDVDENDEGSDRTAYIQIKAGNLQTRVCVMQRNQLKQENYEIIIRTKNSQDEWVEVSELFFIGAASDTPDPASDEFTVTWFPADRELKATLIPGSNALGGTISPFSGTSTIYHVGGTQEYTVSPTPIGTDGGGQAFFEKSAQVLFELSTPTGPITKAINLRQTNYNLVLMPGTILMDGTEQEFHVQANFPWRVKTATLKSHDAASSFDDKIIRNFSTPQFGGNNITTGDPVKLTCFDYITKGYSSTNPTKAIISVEFERLEKGKWVEWGTHDVTCYATVPVGESNCYIIKNTDPVPILIPTSQVGYAMKGASSAGSGFIGTGWIEKPNNLKVEVLWSDINKFYTDDSVIKAVAYNGATDIKDGKIVVVPGSRIGNAGIILYEDNDDDGKYDYSKGDRIRWSWHIWNSTYFPYESGTYPSEAPTVSTTWMDRNVGASSATAGNVGTIGLIYQWGRKDPFPGASAFNNTNTTFRKGPNITSYTFTETDHSVNINLPNAVLNPLTRYFYGSNSTKYDWFTHTGTQNHNLWGGANKTDLFLHTGNGGNKSVYDPCPEGYRVPKNNADGWGTATSWPGGVTNVGMNNASYGGYYPLAGYRYNSQAGLINVGSYGCYWSATQSTSTTTNSFYLYLYSNGTVAPSSGASRANGFSVRCRAE